MQLRERIVWAGEQLGRHECLASLLHLMTLASTTFAGKYRERMEKSYAADTLLKLGLDVPPGFTVTSERLSSLPHLLERYPDVEFWYIRVSREVEGAFLRRVSSKAGLFSLLKSIFEASPRAQVLVQQRVDASFGGVLAKTSDSILIEYVAGALQSLLRDGVSPSRELLDLSGKSLVSQENVQEFSYEWRQESLFKQDTVPPLRLSSSVLERLFNAATRVKGPAILEWVGDRDGAIFFVDYKELRKDFLICQNALKKGLTDDSLLLLDLPIQGRVITSLNPNERGVFVIRRPLHAYIDDVLKWANGVIIEKGGILSHLMFYATRSSIPCLISPRYYATESSNHEVSLSTAEFLPG